MIDTGTDTVRATVDEGVGLIELNRPERRNALHPDMYDAIPRLVARFDDDPDVGAILLTAAGTAFCAGGDVRGGGRRRTDGANAEDPRRAAEADAGRGLAHLARMVLMFRESPKISVAAIPGPAVGAGVGVALCTDLRIAGASARLVGGWAELAFSGDFGATWFLTRGVGPARALDFLTGGLTVDAELGERLGLFNRVVPDADLRAAAVAWARQLAAGPRVAYRFMKENVRDGQALELREALPRESRRMTLSGTTDEHRQAVKRWLAAARAGRERREAGGDAPSRR